ncbi:CheR family methyltransferase [Psychroserpens sp. Hel_I_66]|uniref:CheR family methyltransferase n=1 Tax=Psychroserpens sp. Hel_I_66 TaxID=1250004 RepID=UPI0006475359|nr:CheR family methyltransferase [Psychroserpens sp. Hel_I_66]
MSKKLEVINDTELYVVGVGASAGGLDALSKFLKNFNGITPDLCIVIVMHLSPDYKSQLAPILDKRCKWPVVSAENNMELVKGNVYVTPQNKQIRIHNSKFVLEDLTSEHSFTPSIDNFFKSLSKDKGKKAIGIVLSGFGKDGAEGITAIRELGGFTIAQLPETAEHRDMPSASINTGHVILIVPAEQMYDDIVQFITNTKAIASSLPKKGSIDAIFELLEKRSGTDFSMYKPTTIMRRINHRITSLQLGTMVEYYELIKANPRELDNLFDSVLIGVTEFFRDLEAFDYLRKQLFKILKDKEPGDSIRIWSVGCATGEEPYSIAILLYELLGAKVNQYHIQIFASDIDERAINFGRKGIYNKDLLANVPKEITAKYFEKKDELHFEVKKEIKQHLLFTRHDITTDPPFVKLDLVVCRNLLIYFNNNLQKQTFQIFHYSLRSNGILFLGKSESVSVAADLFTEIGKGKLFRKADTSLNYQLKFSRLRTRNQQQKKEEKKNNIRNMSIVDVAKETLYYKYDNPFVIINENGEIKEVHGSLRLYLEISQGAMNVSIHKMVNPELVTVVKAVLAQVKKTNVTHTSHVIKFELYDQLHYVRVKITPLVYRISEVQYFMVIFEKIEPSEGHLELQKKLETSDFVNLRIKELEDELTSTKEHLQIFTEELEATNEELQTINEELQSSNEELKSSNEELETSNEELQSANEELNIANQELKLANDLLIEKEEELKEEKELSQRNELIYKTIAENIPDGAVGILDKDFKVEYIGGQGVEILETNNMIGQYWPDLNSSKREARRIEKLCQDTLINGSAQIEVQYNNKFYDIKAVRFKMPYLDEDRILYLAQEITSLRQNQVILETAIRASNLMVFEFNFEEDVFYADNSLYDFLEIEPKRTITKQMLLDKMHPDDLKIRKKSMKKALKTGLVYHEVRMKLKKGIRYIRVTGQILFDENKKPLKEFATAIDITSDKELLEKVKESENRFRAIANDAPINIWITDKKGQCVFINKNWFNYTGSTLQDNLGRGWLKYLHEDDKKTAEEAYMKAHEKLITFTSEFRALAKDGTYSWHLNKGIPMFDEEGEFNGFIGSFTNIDEQKKFSNELEKNVLERTKDITNANEELLKLNMNLEEFAYMASHDLKEPLRKIRTFNSLIISEDTDRETVSKYASRIEHSAERMTSLIDNILEYSKVEGDANKSEKVNLDEIFDQVFSDLSIMIEEQNVVINKDDLGTIKGVPIRMYQLFSNLIKNSVKFNNNEPVIEISTSLVNGKLVPKRFKAKAKKEFKKIEFKDNGIGLDIDKKDYIFKPFKRLNSSSDYSGTGIGLAICKRIMDLHGGFIDVESEKGKGASFILYFPV